MSLRQVAADAFNNVRLQTFLSKFVDKSATQMRRLSQTEDDNPPSPVAHMDTVESYLFSAGQAKNASPSVADGGGMSAIRGVSHMPAVGQSLGSNPNTPSSPHTSILSQAGYVASPSNAFALASPPSHALGGQMHPAPSPSLPGSTAPSGGQHTGPEPSPANMVACLPSTRP